MPKRDDQGDQPVQRHQNSQHEERHPRDQPESIVQSDRIERIERAAGLPGLAEALATRLSAPDLQALLLEVARRRARARTPARVLQDYERDVYLRPALTPPARLAEWERVLLRALPVEVEVLALSPLAPLGTSSVVASVPQDWAITTVRAAEVVSDLTNVLALEAASRRRRAGARRVDTHLAAHHRLIRGQRFAGADQRQHFALFGLVSAGRDRGTLRFELAAAHMQLQTYFTALFAYRQDEPALRLALTLLGPDAAAVASRRALVEQHLVDPLHRAFPLVDIGYDDERARGRGYYRDLCFQVDAATADGAWSNLVDGGAVTWTASLLSDAKERAVISGIGSERACAMTTGRATEV